MKLVEGFQDQLSQIASKIGEVDDITNELSQMIIDIKQQAAERSIDLNRIMERVGNVQMGLHQARIEVEKLAEAELGGTNSYPKNEEINQVSEVLPDIIGLGYSRALGSAQNEIWYSHPDGHQLHFRPIKEGEFCWFHFPPGLRGAVQKGYTIEDLKQSLKQAHRKQMQEADSLKIPHRDFLITQIETAPLERYRIWERGHDYPANVAHDPQTGDWKCYNCSGDNEQGPEFDPHIEACRKWKYQGKPKKFNTKSADVDSLLGGGGYEGTRYGEIGTPVAGMPDK